MEPFLKGNTFIVGSFKGFSPIQTNQRTFRVLSGIFLSEECMFGLDCASHDKSRFQMNKPNGITL